MTRKLAAVITATGNGWSFNDTVTGESRLIVQLGDCSRDTEKKLALYGLKQAVADGGAKAKGTSLESRIKGMSKRFDEIVDGTWDFRDGTGSSTMPDADTYRAIIALEMMPDTAESREKWKGLKPAQRRAIAKQDAVAAWLEANITDDTDGDAALAAFLA